MYIESKEVCEFICRESQYCTRRSSSVDVSINGKYVRTDHVLLFNHLNIKTAHSYKSRYDWYTPHTVTPWDSIKIKILKEFSLKS